jgi:hypothetical protein
MLGQVVVEREQRLGVDHLADGLGPLDGGLDGERVDGRAGVLAVFGVADFGAQRGNWRPCPTQH